MHVRGCIALHPRVGARVKVPLLSRIRSRLVHGTTLELRFHLAAKARVRLLAKRRKRVVARTPMRTFAAGDRKLLLRLARQRWRAVDLAIERGAPREQLDDVPGTFANEHIDSSGVAEAIARRNRVLRVQRGRIIGTEGRGNAPLCMAGVAFAWIGLRKNDDVARFRERQRGAQTGDSAADDEEISAHIHFGMLAGSTSAQGLRLRAEPEAP